MKKAFILLTTLLIVNVGYAQSNTIEKRDQPGRQTRKKAQPVSEVAIKKERPVEKFSISMLEGDRIDPRYVGLPIARVVDAVEKLTGQIKGEFESTADFNARRAAAITGKFLGDSSMEDTFAFVVPVTKGIANLGGLKYEFNADTAELRLFALATRSSMNGIGAPDLKQRSPRNGLDQFNLALETDSHSQYQASNAYGATVTVEKTSATQFGIAANNIPFLTYKREKYYSNPAPAVQLTMENTKAAKELPALKAIVVMKLSDPYVVYDYSHSKPTRDDPSDFTMRGKFLTGDVLGIVFYSGLTGEVFARLPDSFGKPEASSTLRGDDQ